MELTIIVCILAYSVGFLWFFLVLDAFTVSKSSLEEKLLSSIITLAVADGIDI